MKFVFRLLLEGMHRILRYGGGEILIQATKFINVRSYIIFQSCIVSPMLKSGTMSYIKLDSDRDLNLVFMTIKKLK